MLDNNKIFEFIFDKNVILFKKGFTERENLDGRMGI